MKLWKHVSEFMMAICLVGVVTNLSHGDQLITFSVLAIGWYWSYIGAKFMVANGE